MDWSPLDWSPDVEAGDGGGGRRSRKIAMADNRHPANALQIKMIRKYARIQYQIKMKCSRSPSI